MEFIIFLSKLDKEILDLLIKANYIIEENKIECLLSKEIKGLHNFEENKIESLINKEIKGLHNFKENIIVICTENAKRKTNFRVIKNLLNKDNFKTERAIRKALRHEATHVAQKCNGNKTVGNINILENKLHQSKRRALEFSTSNFCGTYAKEVEAYILEDRPKKVKEILTKYCL